MIAVAGMIAVAVENLVVAVAAVVVQAGFVAVAGDSAVENLVVAVAAVVVQAGSDRARAMPDWRLMALRIRNRIFCRQLISFHIFHKT